MVVLGAQIASNGLSFDEPHLEMLSRVVSQRMGEGGGFRLDHGGGWMDG